MSPPKERPPLPKLPSRNDLQSSPRESIMGSPKTPTREISIREITKDEKLLPKNTVNKDELLRPMPATPKSMSSKDLLIKERPASRQQAPMKFAFSLRDGATPSEPLSQNGNTNHTDDKIIYSLSASSINRRTVELRANFLDHINKESTIPQPKPKLLTTKQPSAKSSTMSNSVSSTSVKTVKRS